MLGVAKPRWHPQIPTLSRSHRSQTEKPSPNSYPRSNGDSISNPLHSEHLSVAKPRWQPQIPTPSRSHRSQTEKPSPNSYAQPPPPRSNGDSISNPLHSEHLSVAKPRWQPQIPTLTAPQRRQMETTPPNPYTQPPSPQPNRENTPKRPRSQPSPQPYAGALPKWLRSPTPSASNRRNHRQLSTLTNPPAQTDGNDSPKSLHSATLTAAKQRKHTQTATLTALTAAICGSPPQMATLTHAQRIQPEKPSPTVYAHQPPAQTDGNDSPKSPHSAALSVANWRSRTQIATPATVRRG